MKLELSPALSKQNKLRMWRRVVAPLPHIVAGLDAFSLLFLLGATPACRSHLPFRPLTIINPNPPYDLAFYSYGGTYRLGLIGKDGLGLPWLRIGDSGSTST